MNKTPAPAAVKLDDERRVRVLSPGMLVAKRFLRNRLAIVGLVIIIAMFLFSFVGGIIHPYGETQVFQTKDTVEKTYASAAVNTNYYYTMATDSIPFNTSAQAAAILALNNSESTFISQGISYAIEAESENYYLVNTIEQRAVIDRIGKNYEFRMTGGAVEETGFSDAAKAAVANGDDSFIFNDIEYAIVQNLKSYSIGVKVPLALGSKMIYDMYDQSVTLSYNFKLEAQRALDAGNSSFSADGKNYTLKTENDIVTVYENGAPICNMTDLVVTSAVAGTYLDIGFKDAVGEAIDSGEKQFTYGTDEDGNEVSYKVERKDYQYTIKTSLVTTLLDLYAQPSAEHWLGTDGHGMDILVRLMYGGRISLMIGFIVVLLETFIGVILGGISGYFGGWADTLLMRAVDIMNCIPTMPLFFILGAFMDSLNVPSKVRIYYLVIIMGITGWPGIARVVRGQILSLREQEFMTATEATGISVSRRIFRHLVPNVIPQLIVYATMGLGSVILTEATLSFLGLGVKFPYASWGNMITAVNDSFVMKSYLCVWIPAGTLILLTVLGFNFIGDGLRDAFDPKMKR